MKKIKLATSAFIKDNFAESGFSGWAAGYSSFTFHENELPRLLKYVANQEEHHINTSAKKELIDLLDQHQVEYDPKYLPEID